MNEIKSRVERIGNFIIKKYLKFMKRSSFDNVIYLFSLLRKLFHNFFSIHLPFVKLFLKISSLSNDKNLYRIV